MIDLIPALLMTGATAVIAWDILRMMFKSRR